MKKMVALLLIASIIMAFAGCGAVPAPATEPPVTQAQGEQIPGEGTADKEDYDIEGWAKNGLTFIVPNKAGGGFDLIVRLVAKYFTEKTGITVAVENKNGGGGLVAMTEYLIEQPNSTKFLAVGHANWTISPIYGENTDLDLTEYTPVMGLDSQQRILFVNPDKTGIKDLDGLFEYAKENYATFSSNGETGQMYLISKGMFKMNGIDAGYIYSATNPEALVSVLNGDITCSIVDPSTGAQYVENNSLLPLCVFSEESYTGYEGVTVPTAKSLGLDIVSDGFRFISARKGTDQEIIDYMYDTIAEIYADPAFQAEAAALEAECLPRDTQACLDKLNQMLEAHTEMYNKIYN